MIRPMYVHDREWYDEAEGHSGLGAATMLAPRQSFLGTALWVAAGFLTAALFSVWFLFH